MFEGLSICSFNEILSATCKKSLFEQTAYHVRQLGFKNFAYRHQIAGMSSSRCMLDGFPAEWRLRYDAADYLSIDPVVQHCRCRTVPLIWNDELYTTGRAKTMRDEAKSYGLVYGLSCPVHDRSGAISMLSMATDDPFERDTIDVLRLLSLSQLLASFVHAAMQELLDCRLRRQGSCDLTARERESLQWAGRGKTAWEISKILGISERTVVFHLSNAARKIGANNRAQAVVIASARGMI
ncbi:LuxR family transcriptional regulator [Burkholderia sp. MSMB617WGS]|uniref:LuxR family transcriptional regulator n=1 Tax=Burkholderia savannae TaxID=1637837 RepID=A0ABR5T6S4_9BURK|nr:LuxR family transcriptional regulator [Burkholderia savannae]AOK50687.1 LuxR family transcriptional regulator [Burkholderia sp. MSMB617WGS]KGR98193.1 bacterial regulatory s, luxR family protein [Burkholderia sp. ABCPW 111]KVG44221.1 LuxR family transcriptional regulator [Burkholderia sp. MSMB0265]KVG87748.1 LuxR family transcriptional regulator [Burkholderia sp. MSMB2040]KVG96409.1 LuxR family transcriptional regulator [Burkholderia sp. MSMB2042]KVG97150.1 LuxR family transcriptional regul